MDIKKENQRLLRTYGITWDEYQSMLAKQGGGCAICKKVPENGQRKLAVDHCHRTAKLKVKAAKIDRFRWEAWVVQNPIINVRSAHRSEAVAAVKQLLKKLSTRGLLCSFCNRGLRYYKDSSNTMARAAQYLASFEEKIRKLNNGSLQ